MPSVDIDRKKYLPTGFTKTCNAGLITVYDESNFMGDYNFSNMKEGYIVDGVYTNKPDLDLIRKEDAEFVIEHHTLLNYTRE